MEGDKVTKTNSDSVYVSNIIDSVYVSNIIDSIYVSNIIDSVYVSKIIDEIRFQNTVPSFENSVDPVQIIQLFHACL